MLTLSNICSQTQLFDFYSPKIQLPDYSLYDSTGSKLSFNSTNAIIVPKHFSQSSHSVSLSNQIRNTSIQFNLIQYDYSFDTDTLSKPLIIDLRKKYLYFNTRAQFKYYNWKINLGGGIIPSSNWLTDYTLGVSRKYKKVVGGINYSQEIQPKFYGLGYENFQYAYYSDYRLSKFNLFHSNNFANLQYWINLDYGKYINMENDQFESSKSGFENIDIKLEYLLTSNFLINYHFLNKKDSLSYSFIKDQLSFFRVNYLEGKVRSHELFLEYNGNGNFFIGTRANQYKLNFSGRLNIQQISDNLFEIFTVPIVNTLDSLELKNFNYYIEYQWQRENAYYQIGLSYTHSPITYYHRITTPPFHPLVPITKIKSDKINLESINFNLSLYKQFEKIGLEIKYFKIIPHSYSSIDPSIKISNIQKLIILNRLNFKVSIKI